MMKYLLQFALIGLISLVAEMMGYFIPIPVPASIYGLVLLFLLL
ncbi:MAG: CidA/LrgA family protein, partial [Bacteroidales bacterium]|nr:CidA/LrgA family protein [Bacteroidales bacterium]